MKGTRKGTIAHSGWQKSGPILSLLEEPQRRVIQTPEALKNEDILSLIFQHFDLQPGSQTAARTRKDLFSAAKTCKAFVEPALDSLWRVLPSLLPLLLLLPSAEVDRGQYFVDELPLDDSGWERLDAHARRVRTLYMEPQARNIEISPDIYLRIRAMRDSPFLPGLKKIYIPGPNSDAHDHWPVQGPSSTFFESSIFDLSSALFLASVSTLNTVQLDHDATSVRQFFVPFLSLLYIKSPGLSHLALRGVDLSTSVEHIDRFTMLQSLEIRLRNPRLHPEFLHKLGQLPHLLDLIIDTGEVNAPIQPHTDSDPISISDSNFRQLSHLQILGTLTAISCILNELKGLTNLNALKIDEVWYRMAGIPITDSSWNSSFEVISTFSALEDIEITLNRPRGQYTHSACSFAPLFRLENLKSFVINFDVAFSGSDDGLHLLAGGFPKLKKFVFSGPPFPNKGFPDGRTLACLYHLSQKCPDLREIKISLSLDIFDNLNAIKNLPHPLVRNHQHPLEKLYINSDFGQLQPIQLVQVARFLDVIFPNLSTLEMDNSKSTEAANWEGIHELCLALRDARINPSFVNDI